MEVTIRYQNLDGETLTETLDNVTSIVRDEPNDSYHEFRVLQGDETTIFEGDILEVQE